MRAIDTRMPNWNYQGFELGLWHLDQLVNDRGFAVDVELAEAAIRAIDIEQTRLRGAAWAHSDGALDSATQRDALLIHILAEYHIVLPDMKSSTLERRLLDPEIPEGAKGAASHPAAGVHHQHVEVPRALARGERRRAPARHRAVQRRRAHRALGRAHLPAAQPAAPVQGLRSRRAAGSCRGREGGRRRPGGR
jgi:hypothetical protein